jgi:hypothetical protein
MSIHRTIKGPREYRLLAYLLKNGPTFRKTLNDIVGANNVPEHVRQMRHHTRGWILPCTRVFMTDRDGKRTNPGRYSVDPKELGDAKRAVLEWEEWEERKGKGAATPLPQDMDNPNPNGNAK